MTTITPEEIAQSRSALADYPEALDALQIIEDVDGNLEDAVDVILIEAAVSRTREPAEFIEQQARNLRRVICQEEFQDAFVDGFSADLLGMLVPLLMAELAISGALPAALAVAIVMYLLKGNIKRFCEGDSDADDKKESEPESDGDVDDKNESKPDDDGDGTNGGDNSSDSSGSSANSQS